MYALTHVRSAGDSSVDTRGSTGNTTVKQFTPSKPGDGLRTVVDSTATIPAPPGGDALLSGPVTFLLNVKPVRIEGANLTVKNVNAFCDHI